MRSGRPFRFRCTGTASVVYQTHFGLSWSGTLEDGTANGVAQMPPCECWIHPCKKSNVPCFAFLHMKLETHVGVLLQQNPVSLWPCLAHLFLLNRLPVYLISRLLVERESGKKKKHLGFWSLSYRKAHKKEVGMGLSASPLCPKYLEKNTAMDTTLLFMDTFPDLSHPQASSKCHLWSFCSCVLWKIFLMFPFQSFECIHSKLYIGNKIFFLNYVIRSFLSE